MNITIETEFKLRSCPEEYNQLEANSVTVTE